ncbi:MAG: DUF3224 domain-containing protein [Myxococcota bacterium]
MNYVNGAHVASKKDVRRKSAAYPLLVALAAAGLFVGPSGSDALAWDDDDDRGRTTTTGDLDPLYADFIPIAFTPEGYATVRVDFGTQFSGGGLVGTTDDLEYQILDPDGSGEINGVGTFTGSVDGRQGGFIFESVGVQNADGTFRTVFKVKPNTAWGELVGIRATGRVTATLDHCGPDDTPETCPIEVTYRFRYRFR